MRWPNLVGKARFRPGRGSWSDWKEAIADYCESRCVYCAIHEGRFGGLRNFHVEHFRPKARFPEFENEIANLYLACAICNVLKSDDWPAEPASDHSRLAYPDPGGCDYNAIFAIDAATHGVTSKAVAGKYLIERILLNRPQLVLERRFAAMLKFFDEFESWVSRMLGEMTLTEAKQTAQLLLEINGLTTSAIRARPYRTADTKRPTRSKKAKRH